MLQAVNARELIRTKQVEPSILSADYSRLGEQLETVMDAGARAIHVDVMDGHFVPPITIGPVIVESIREQVHAAGGILDCHLMVERPERQIEQFAAAGADSITIQVEATPNVHFALQQIREAGCLAGLAINPATPVEAVAEVVDLLDLVLCMTVNPGWGGQAFIETSPGQGQPAARPGRARTCRSRSTAASAPSRRHRAGRRGDAVRRRLGDLRRARPGAGIPRDRRGGRAALATS